MAKASEFGKEIKKKLVDLDKNQNWLIDQVKERTGLFFDSGYLWKVMAGVLTTPKICTAIREILGMKEE